MHRWGGAVLGWEGVSHAAQVALGTWLGKHGCQTGLWHPAFHVQVSPGAQQWHAGLKPCPDSVASAGLGVYFASVKQFICVALLLRCAVCAEC